MNDTSELLAKTAEIQVLQEELNLLRRGRTKSKEPVILGRKGILEGEELQACSRTFKTVFSKGEMPIGALVIPRYSALPFNNEFVKDVEALGCHTINSFREHEYVADLQNWYYDLEGLTPKTWFFLEHVDKSAGPYVLKGQTNSKKYLWGTHMYAETFSDAVGVYSKLAVDGLIGQQNIYVRKYERLERLGLDIGGLPVSLEYRFFILDKKVLASGFYWSTFTDDIKAVPAAEDVVPQSFLDEVITRVGDNVRFWVVDVARKVDGSWTVIELNDGQQSGLSCIDHELFYKNLRAAL
jgi:hypothetical protein